MSHFLRRQKGAGGKWKTKTSCKQDQEITNYEKKTSTNKNVDVYFFFLAPKNKVLLTSSKSFACEKRFFIIPPLY